MIDRFLICLPYTLTQEGSYSNDPHDPGGATMWGITQKEYDIWRKGQHVPVQDVRLLTTSERTTIYRTSYWMPYCPAMPPGLDMSFFDTDVNEGAFQATKILQAALGVAVDGYFGPHTQDAIERVADVPAAIRAFTKVREAVYKSFRNFRYFGKGWEQRAATIGAVSLEMASGNTS